jgi:pimeloyl-ACP methyl ester carboxylesterase
LVAVDSGQSYLYTGAQDVDPAKPWVVFVHGAGMDHSVWILQSRYFAHHGFNTLAVDLPGHGRSSGEPAESIEASADWLIRLLDAVGCTRAALVGHSMGALIVLEAAARYPERSAALAMLGVTVPMVVSDRLMEAAAANDHSALDMINIWGHGFGARIGKHPVPGMWMIGGALRVLERSAPGVLHTDLRACNDYKVGLQSAARVSCPALAMLGRQDLMTPPKTARRLVDALPGCHSVTFDPCGHMMMTEQSDAVLDALIGHLRPMRAAV